MLVSANVWLQSKLTFWTCWLVTIDWVNLKSLRPIEVNSTHLSRAYRDSDLRVHRDENSALRDENLWKNP